MRFMVHVHILYGNDFMTCAIRGGHVGEDVQYMFNSYTEDFIGYMFIFLQRGFHEMWDTCSHIILKQVYEMWGTCAYAVRRGLA